MEGIGTGATSAEQEIVIRSGGLNVSGFLEDDGYHWPRNIVESQSWIRIEPSRRPSSSCRVLSMLSKTRWPGRLVSPNSDP
jgi:hypothetical protein